MTIVVGTRATGGIGDSDTADVAVSELFRSHYWSMVRLARQFVDDQETAEDVAQEAFLALHRGWDRLHDPGTALTYVRSCVLNQARSRVRRIQVRRKHDRAELEQHLPGAETALLESEETDRMTRALHRLPRRQREVLVLRYWGELDEAEIARTLGIGRGSVKTHASRGLRALAQLVDR